MDTRPVDGPRTLCGRYELGAVLGRGGMGEVRAGYDTRLHRDVAVKILRPDMAADPSVRRRFESEARLAARLTHPNVVAVFDSGEEDGIPFLVMERLPGRTLANAIAAGPIDTGEVRLIGGEVLEALDAAHAAGMVHRDVKPGNVLSTGTGRWKVADFGIAKSLEVGDGDMTMTGMIIGTPAYLAPERVAGGPATVATDLYATGVLLYEALTGRRPVESGAPPAALLSPSPIPVEQLRPDVPPDLAAVVTRAMAIDPRARFADAAAMASALRSNQPTSAPEPTVSMAGPPGPAMAGPSIAEPGMTATEAFTYPAPAAPADPWSAAAAADPWSPAAAADPWSRGAPAGGAGAGARAANSQRLLIVAGVVVALLVVLTLAVALLGHGGTAKGPTTTSVPATVAPATTPSTAALPGPLDSALKQLERQVQP